MREYVVFDLEANADRAEPPAHEIIDIGAVVVSGGVVSDSFETLVRPSRRLRRQTVQLTGLADDDLVSAPTPAQALAAFADFAGGRPLVAHNGLGYDYPLLDAATDAAALPSIGGQRLDSLELAHLAFGRAGAGMTRSTDGSTPPPGRRLDDLAERLLGRSPRPQHRALADARLLADVLPPLLATMNDKAPPRRLQRWVLHGVAHPWAAFMDPEPKPPLLAATIPVPLPRRRPEPTETFDPEAVAGLLDEGGALMSHGRSPRAQQVQMARMVAMALAKGERRLIEAPTGTGKTFAYLVPAIEYARASGSTVAIAPHSKVLQDQIAQSLEELAEHLAPFESVLLKGRSNYIDVTALASELLELDPAGVSIASDQGVVEADETTPNARTDGQVRLTDADRGLALAILCGWVSQTPTGDWDDLNAWALSAGPRAALSRLRFVLSVSARPAQATTDLDRRCFYRRARDGLRRADIAVLNHALTVTDEDWLDHAKHLVLDEAHNLEDSATDALTSEVGEDELDLLCDALDPRTGGGGVVGRLARAARWSVREAPLSHMRRCVADVRDQAPRFGAALSSYVRVRTAASVDGHYPSSHRIRPGIDTAHPDYDAVLREGRLLAETLEGVVDKLNEINLPEQLEGNYRRDRLEAEMHRLGRFAREAARTLRRVIHADSGPFGSGVTQSTDIVAGMAAQRRISVAQVEHTDGRWIWRLQHVPVSVAPELGRLWSSLEATVATSATLQVGDSFSHVVDSLGLGGAQTMALPTPFDALSQQHLLILADWLPAPRARLMDEFTEEANREVGRLMLLAQGRTMALYAARARMAAARDKLRDFLDEHGIPLLAQGDAPAAALVARMRTELASSLLALRSFWEGVDIPGEALSLLLLEKVPFDSPMDPVTGARMEALEMQGKDGFADYAVPRAALRMAQGAGRLIRTADDRGVTVMLDNRLCRATSYADRILATQPGPPTRHRVRDPRRAYELICGHLDGIDLTAELLNAMDAVPVDDTLAQVRALELSEVEASDRNVAAQRLDRVRQIFGFERWRPGQLETMRRFMAGEDTLAVLPTGSGKSITYQIPALLLPGVTLVLSPLIALMNDQVDHLRRRGITRVAAIHSGVGQSEWRDVLRGARQGHYKLLYVSPERLWSQEFISRLAELDVARIAVDEAHCISQWGHTFRPEYSNIPEALARLADGRQTRQPTTAAGAKRPPVLAVTATANTNVREDIVASLGLDCGKQMVLSPDRPEIRYHTERCADRRDRDVRVAQVVESFRRQAAVVYVPTRRDSERVSGLLRVAGHVVRAYHGGMETAARAHVEDAFRHGEIDVVVATKAFGMGIDKPDIALIVHTEMPASIEEYVQETGRAARGAGQPGMPTHGTAVLLTMPRDCSIHRMFVRSAAPPVELVRRIWSKLRLGTVAYDPSDFVDDADGEARDGDADSIGAALAIHYLTLAGAVRRHPDTPWEGRVTVVADSERRVDELQVQGEGASTADGSAERALPPQIAARARHLMEMAEQHDGRYEAPVWSQALERPVAEITDDLLALERADVIGFSVWKYGWALERLERAPNWADIEQRCEARTREVAEKSNQAKAFAHEVGRCRVESLLAYLDAPATLAQTAEGGCGRCDACVELPRPWATSHLTATRLREALPVAQTILRLLADIEGAGYSRTNVERCLVGDFYGLVAVPEHLARHPSAGRLAFVGMADVKSAIDELIAEGFVAASEADFGGTSYQRLELTDAGRDAIGAVGSGG